jgi:hypothetical protein
LIFVGSKLDSKSCETLEEVLRKVRTKTLDLENTSLEDEVSICEYEWRLLIMMVVYGVV